MTEKRLTDALSDAARAERDWAARFDALWDRWQQGSLDAAGQAELERLLATTPESLQALAEPLDRQFRQHIADRIWSQLEAAAQPAHESTPGDSDADNVVPLRWTNRSRATGLLTALAASVLVVFGVFGVLRDSAVAPLPSYELMLDGAVTEVRGEAPSAPRRVFADGNFFDLQLTPEAAVTAELLVRLYTFDGSELAPLPAPDALISDQGVVRIEATVGEDLALPPGQSTVVVVVAGADSVPSARLLERRLQRATELGGDGWLAWRLPVERR